MHHYVTSTARVQIKFARQALDTECEGYQPDVASHFHDMLADETEWLEELIDDPVNSDEPMIIAQGKLVQYLTEITNTAKTGYF